MNISRRTFALASVAGLAFAATPLAALADAAAEKDADEEAPSDEPVADEQAAPEGSITAPAGSIEAAEQLLDALQGEYVELFPVINERRDVWIEVARPIVGDAAGEIVDMLQHSMTSELSSEEAVAAFADADTSEWRFNCYFPSGVKRIVIEGDTISGFDDGGAEVFSHEYEYMLYNPNMDFYVFRTLDGDAGDFRYFAPRPDNMADTYHLEFRMGDDLDDIFDFFTGDYAFVMPAAISADADEETIAKCIELFVTENLAAE